MAGRLGLVISGCAGGDGDRDTVGKVRASYPPETISNFGPGRRKPEHGDGWLVRKSLPLAGLSWQKPPKTERFRGLATWLRGCATTDTDIR
jgi:hypothetical protein